MPTYEFTRTTVQAQSEREARHLAMTKLWGAPAPLTLPQPRTKGTFTWIPDTGDTYEGRGLHLIDVRR